jgi:hypothetical protein
MAHPEGGRARGPLPPHHHDVPVAQFTCGWADGTRRGCGQRAETVVKSRTGRVLFLCSEDEHKWNHEQAERRLTRQEGENCDRRTQEVIVR